MLEAQERAGPWHLTSHTAPAASYDLHTFALQVSRTNQRDIL